MRKVLILSLAVSLAGCAGLTTKSWEEKPSQAKERPTPGQTAGTSGDSSTDSSAQALSTSDVTDDFERSRLIAVDFVATLSQIPETDPDLTVLHTSKPSSRFGELFLSALQGAGYDLRLGDNTSDSWLSYNANQDQQPTIDGNPVYTFIVSAADVKLKRSYAVDENGVQPTGNMFIRGASAADLVMDDSIFNGNNPVVEKPKVAVDTVAKSKPVDSSSNGADSLVEESKVIQRIELSAVPATKPIEATPNATPDFTTNEDWDAMSNMYTTRASRYKEIFKSYEVLESNVLIFADDSLVLGRGNKRSIASIAEGFNPQTDVMSVVGCSHGGTKIKNGNAYLANNRAIRVKNEFVAVGLNHNLVYEEGCWADEHFPQLPARGVLVQHRRVKS